MSASTLYFAYGSNLDPAGMLARCPAARRLGRATLPDHRLVFRLWADVVPHPGAVVRGGLWRITPACRAALDLYEGVEEGLYRGLLVAVRPEGGDAPLAALVYRMAATHEAPPEPAYLATVLAGCRAFGLEEGPVLAAAAALGFALSPGTWPACLPPR